MSDSLSSLFRTACVTLALCVVTAPAAAQSVTGADIVDGSITGVDLANDAVAGAKLRNGAVATAKIRDGAVTETKLAAAVLGRIAELERRLLTAEIRLAVLEGEAAAFSTAAMAGAYKLLNIYGGTLNTTSGATTIHASTQTGTLTLQADGTFGFAVTEINSQTRVNLATDSAQNTLKTTSDEVTGTWLVSDRTLTLYSGSEAVATYEIGVGNRVLFNPVRSDSGPGLLGIDILLRQ